MDEGIYFAIGDVHGESGKLAELHEAILARIVFEKLPAHVIHLGDYVDRGRDSRGVIEQVMAFEENYATSPVIRVTSLMGNHEQMMLDWLGAGGNSWVSQGGAETLQSYGAAPDGSDWREHIPQDHLDWMSDLPSMVRDPERKLVFVHAGIDPATFPDCRDQVRLWTRSASFMDHGLWPQRRELDGLMVVHGHTPKGYEPENFPHRINVDTAACFGGPLTAVMLKKGAAPEFLRAS
jgi:serine/threonine protein phosphatase 1